MTFFRWAKAETCTTRNVKGWSSERNMISEGDLDLHKEMKISRSGLNEGKYKKYFFIFNYSKRWLPKAEVTKLLLWRTQIVNILGFESQMVSVATAQLCHCSMKAIKDNTQKIMFGCVPMKPYLQK